MPEPIAIAGAGRIGQALGRLLRERGESVVAVASRDPERAAEAAAFVGGGARAATYAEIPQHAAHVLIAVPDDAIAEVAHALAVAGMCGGIALHTSGARGPEALADLAAAGVACGTLHPLQTVANPQEGVRVLRGVAFAIDGPLEAAAWAGRLAVLLDGVPLHVPSASRPLYHAAAVMASNYLIALISTAVILMKEAGVEEAIARRALEPLARTSLENAFRLGPAAALTGPIARGDADTVRGHLAALAKAPASVTSLYRAAGLATVEIARQRGLAEPQAGTIEKLLRKGDWRD
ncbi:MAG: F420-dependent NADP oxidoreductase [Bryobacteraceae bacterium]|jgi:predicted short-subunit dehydrogenase-like oxidoreductase (DUF2520 family)